ncbi:MAG: hypothetical protein HYU66_00215 [Armatimonadetes bacterium]|nr:hypothetical protein [Armatimonadota bacterium]
MPRELPLRPGRLAAAVAGASFIGPADGHDFPVLFLPEVLLDAAELRVRHPDIESGGILLGHLYHDPSVPEVFAVMTALVPFRPEHTEATAASLRITPEAWMAASAAIELRGRGELALGWEHHHPNRAWQADDAETDPVGDAAFFSGADVGVMTATFPQPWAAALVVSDTALADGGWATRFSVFGWREAAVVERGFHLVAEELAATLAMGEMSHVTTTGT